MKESALLQLQTVGLKKVLGLPKSIKFSDNFCGLHSTFDITKDQGVYTWGLNNYGQPGTDNLNATFLPKRLPQNLKETRIGKRIQ